VPGFQNYFPSYEDFSCCFFSFCRLLWMYLMRSCHVPVMSPTNLSVRSVIWGLISIYVEWSSRFAMMCVISHSSENKSASIVESFTDLGHLKIHQHTVAELLHAGSYIRSGRVIFFLRLYRPNSDKTCILSITSISQVSKVKKLPVLITLRVQVWVLLRIPTQIPFRKHLIA
jgi:hypothetical protein